MLPCQSDPEAFFPSRSTPLAEIQEAQVACSNCFFRRECRDIRRATNSRYGIWGGRVFEKWDDDDSKYQEDWADYPDTD